MTDLRIHPLDVEDASQRGDNSVGKSLREEENNGIWSTCTRARFRKEGLFFLREKRGDVGVQKMIPQNMALWHAECFKRPWK